MTQKLVAKRWLTYLAALVWLAFTCFHADLQLLIADSFNVPLLEKLRPVAAFLGSGLIDQSQKMTVAAMQMADMNVCAHRS
jgi:hypothetical protein